ELALANIVSILISGIFSIFLAWKGFGVWALAWQGVIASITLTLGYIILCKWQPEFKFNYNYLRELTGYGANLLGHSTINYWLRNLDSLIIGKFIGSTELGLYTRGYSLMLLPLNNISAVIGRVMFPVLTKLQNDLVQFKQVYLQATRLIALVTFPLMFLLFVVSKPLILLIYGEKWSGVIPIFKYLCLVGLVQSIVFPVAWIFQAIGRTDIQFRLSLILGLLFVLAMFIGVNFGLMGIVYAYIIISIPSAYLNLKYAGKLINIRLDEILNVLKYIFISGLLMAMGINLINSLLNHNLPNWLLLIINFSAGSILYFLLIRFFKEPGYLYILNLLKEEQLFNSLKYTVTSIALKMGISESKEQ
ncbi:MAG: lipopolysaccharide biosynthesis protein, partial [Candidatus Sumerlaeia bacterium]|nr:lipopolysaccharide biosynthesis protein [Candidatus Sumerlaeia bacterium]